MDDILGRALNVIDDADQWLREHGWPRPGTPADADLSARALVSVAVLIQVHLTLRGNDTPAIDEAHHLLRRSISDIVNDIVASGQVDHRSIRLIEDALDVLRSQDVARAVLVDAVTSELERLRPDEPNMRARLRARLDGSENLRVAVEMLSAVHHDLGTAREEFAASAPWLLRLLNEMPPVQSAGAPIPDRTGP